jgi:hypothetical protein
MKSIGILIATLIIYLMQLLGLHASNIKMVDQLTSMEGVTCLSFSHESINTIDIHLNQENKNLSGVLNQDQDTKHYIISLPDDFSLEALKELKQAGRSMTINNRK